MPHRNRNPGSGKPPHNGPARPDNAGTWATGTGGGALRRFTAENARLAVQRRDDPAAREVRDEVRAGMLNVLLDVAESPRSAGSERINAADKLLSRIDGQPTARTELSIRDVPAEQMTDDELAIIATGGRRPTAATASDPD